MKNLFAENLDLETIERNQKLKENVKFLEEVLEQIQHTYILHKLEVNRLQNKLEFEAAPDRGTIHYILFTATDKGVEFLLTGTGLKVYDKEIIKDWFVKYPRSREGTYGIHVLIPLEKNSPTLSIDFKNINTCMLGSKFALKLGEL